MQRLCHAASPRVTRAGSCSCQAPPRGWARKEAADAALEPCSVAEGDASWLLQLPVLS